MLSITLDARTSSTLDWDLTKAKEADSISWDLDLGLETIDSESEVLTLELSLNHFLDTVWVEFSEKTVSTCLYRGHIQSIDTALLDHLAARLPEEANAFADLSLEGIEDPLEQVRLLSKERFRHIRVAPPVDSSRGILLPLLSEENWEPIRPLLASVEEPFRLIPESELINMWDGLDTLYVTEECVSREGLRKIAGFVAAGGSVIPSQE